MRGLVFDITPVGFGKAERDMRTIAVRLRNARPAFELVLRLLERGEERLFKRFRGKYVDTGALKASLTQPDANDAIRVAHADELEFGTKLFYAKYLTDKNRKSAVLRLLPKERKEANATILEYIMHGVGGGGESTP